MYVFARLSSSSPWDVVWGSIRSMVVVLLSCLEEIVRRKEERTEKDVKYEKRAVIAQV
jgi:hypothetical protein